MRLIPMLFVSLALGAGAVSAIARSSPASAASSGFSEDERSKDGPDSARVALILSALEKTDPVICDLITDQIGSHWWGDSRSGIGRLVDRPAQLDVVKDSVASRVSDPRAIDRLVVELDAASHCTRRLASRMLGRSTATASRLAGLLANSSARIRESAAYAAGNRNSMDLRSALEKALDDREPAVAAMAAWALGKGDDATAIPALVRSARHANAHVRASSVWALSSLNEDEENQEAIVPVLRDALGDRDIKVRRAAVEAYGDLDEIRVAPPALVAALTDGDAELRYLAARALAEIADPSTTKQLIELLADPDRELRKSAVEALGNIGSKDAIAGLTRALNDKDREVRKAAVEALGETKDR